MQRGSVRGLSTLPSAMSVLTAHIRWLWQLPVSPSLVGFLLCSPPAMHCGPLPHLWTKTFPTPPPALGFFPGDRFPVGRLLCTTGPSPAQIQTRQERVFTFPFEPFGQLDPSRSPASVRPTVLTESLDSSRSDVPTRTYRSDASKLMNYKSREQGGHQQGPS